MSEKKYSIEMKMKPIDPAVLANLVEEIKEMSLAMKKASKSIDMSFKKATSVTKTDDLESEEWD